MKRNLPLPEEAIESMCERFSPVREEREALSAVRLLMLISTCRENDGAKQEKKAAKTKRYFMEDFRIMVRYPPSYDM